MKKVVILIFYFVLFSFFGYSQTIENIEYISPENEGVIAIKKNNQWAFINKIGEIVIDFRNDLVVTKTNNESCPIFYNNRCLISKKKDGISYFGFIDKSGKTIIETQFLNATNFNNNVAIVLILSREEFGVNEYLNKPIIRNRCSEVIINTKGEKLHYITEPKNISLRKDILKKPPVITSRIISDNLIAIFNNQKWEVKKLE